VLLAEEEITRVRRKRKTKNQKKDQNAETHLARGVGFFWELGAP
jgi:hypothetical protein